MKQPLIVWRLQVVIVSETQHDIFRLESGRKGLERIGPTDRGKRRTIQRLFPRTEHLHRLPVRHRTTLQDTELQRYYSLVTQRHGGRHHRKPVLLHLYIHAVQVVVEIDALVIREHLNASVGTAMPPAPPPPTPPPKDPAHPRPKVARHLQSAQANSFSLQLARHRESYRPVITVSADSIHSVAPAYRDSPASAVSWEDRLWRLVAAAPSAPSRWASVPARLATPSSVAQAAAEEQAARCVAQLCAKCWDRRSQIHGARALSSARASMIPARPAAKEP